MENDITVLVVDDDPEVLAATSRIVRSAGLDVLEASTGKEAMALARANRPDLILFDVILPDARGTELCKQIKADPFFNGTLVVLLSGFKTSPDDQADGLDDGADGYIARPVSNRELKSRVNALVRILKAERERDRLIAELSTALEKVKTLSGFLPICCNCKNIRDDKGYWNRIEDYIRDHSEADFSHSICQECAKKLYPDYDLYEE